MGWRSVIITQHAKLSYSAHMMRVQTGDGINQIPIEDIDLLLISTTQAVISSALISELAKNNTKVIFTDTKNQPICETQNYYPNNRGLNLLKRQFNWNEDRQQKLWTKIIELKIINQLKVLKLRKIECADLEPEIDKLEIGDPTNREAIVAQKYFPRLFNEQNFSRRNASAANAALDYGYSILLSTVNKEIVANGYLTQLGIHHHNDENQFNLGSDLMECFRPVVDYWVSGQKFNELTPDIKYGLVDMLNVELEYNGKTMLLRNIIPDYVRKCLNYLNNETDSMDIEVNFKDEVPNNAINGHV